MFFSIFSVMINLTFTARADKNYTLIVENCDYELVKTVGNGPQTTFDYYKVAFTLYNEGPEDSRYTSHLVMVMGGAEVCFELTELIDHDGWDKIWLQYCELYNKGKDGVGGGSFPNWHARLTAYAGKTKNDPDLIQRAWREFFGRRTRRTRYVPRRIEGPDVLNPIDEVRTIGTNGTAQWCLNAIELLELIGDEIPENNPLWNE